MCLFSAAAFIDLSDVTFSPFPVNTNALLQYFPLRFHHLNLITLEVRAGTKQGHAVFIVAHQKYG